jgi:hypothetical protein
MISEMNKTKLIKEIKAICPIELKTSEMKVLNFEQLEEFKQDLLNSQSLTKSVGQNEI